MVHQQPSSKSGTNNHADNDEDSTANEQERYEDLKAGDQPNCASSEEDAQDDVIIHDRQGNNGRCNQPS